MGDIEKEKSRSKSLIPLAYTVHELEVAMKDNGSNALNRRFVDMEEKLQRMA